MEENQVLNPFMSAEIDQISAALSEFQGTIEQPKLEKDVNVRMKSGGTYSFKYADLSACCKAAAPVLKANGLAVTQIVNCGRLLTLLTHKSGQWIKSEVGLPSQSADYQAYGSAITYLKRYSYCAILGIVADTDDDANAAMGNEAQFRSNARESMRQAVYEVNAAQTIEAVQEVWGRWQIDCPSLCENGSEFYNAVAARIQALKKAM